MLAACTAANIAFTHFIPRFFAANEECKILVIAASIIIGIVGIKTNANYDELRQNIIALIFLVVSTSAIQVYMNESANTLPFMLFKLVGFCVAIFAAHIWPKELRKAKRTILCGLLVAIIAKIIVVAATGSSSAVLEIATILLFKLCTASDWALAQDEAFNPNSACRACAALCLDIFYSPLKAIELLDNSNNNSDEDY